MCKILFIYVLIAIYNQNDFEGKLLFYWPLKLFKESKLANCNFFYFGNSTFRPTDSDHYRTANHIYVTPKGRVMCLTHVMNLGVESKTSVSAVLCALANWAQPAAFEFQSIDRHNINCKKITQRSRYSLLYQRENR